MYMYSNHSPFSSPPHTHTLTKKTHKLCKRITFIYQNNERTNQICATLKQQNGQYHIVPYKLHEELILPHWRANFSSNAAESPSVQITESIISPQMSDLFILKDKFILCCLSSPGSEIYLNTAMKQLQVSEPGYSIYPLYIYEYQYWVLLY